MADKLLLEDGSSFLLLEDGSSSILLENASAFAVVASANVAAGGEATTARLTAPSGKSSGDFTTGRRWDDENGSDALTIAADQWTTVAWVIQADSGVVIDSEEYEFRIVADNVALDTYSVTPKWTIGSPAAPSLPLPQGAIRRIPALLRF